MGKFKKIVFAGILLVSMLVSGVSAGASSVNWGLSFPTPGKAPQGMAGRDALLELDSYFVGDENEKVIYLTFDAGFENGYMENVLNVLQKTEVPAAFFLVGTYIRDNPALVQRMVSEGHIVANHTMSHPDMSAISDMEAFKKELSQVEDIYKNLIGQDMPKYYRPPRGVYNAENLKMAQELGYKTVFWSLAYVDWNVDKQPSHDEAFNKLIPRSHPGMVLLLHSTSRTNSEILEELIMKYKAMGFEFKSLDHLVA